MRKGRSEEKLEKVLADFTESLAGKTDATMAVNSKEVDPLLREEALPLFKTVQIISSVIQPRQLPEGFEIRASHAARERFQEQMSAKKIQRIIGMAVTMEDFRKSLFQNIVTTCRGIGVTLTPSEIASLRNLKEDAVKEFANSLDERITKFFPINLS
jgi:hypothetical protein